MEKIFCLDSSIESGASDCHMQMIFWLAGMPSDAKRPSDDAERPATTPKGRGRSQKAERRCQKAASDDAKRPRATTQKESPNFIESGASDCHILASLYLKRGERERSPQLTQIMLPSSPHQGESQASTPSKCNEEASTWRNCLADHSIL